MEPNSTPNFGALLYTDIIGQIIKDALEVCNITVRLFDMELFLSIGEIAMSTPSYQFPMTIEMFINKLKFAFESRGQYAFFLLKLEHISRHALTPYLELLAVTNPLPEPSISYCIGWNDIMGLMNRHGFNNGSPGDNPNVAGMRTSFQALMLLKLRSFGEISYLHDSIAASIVHAGVAEAFGKSLEKTMTLHVKDLTAVCINHRAWLTNLRVEILCLRH